LLLRSPVAVESAITARFLLHFGTPPTGRPDMLRFALVFLALTASAEAGQVRSSFQVGLTITGRSGPSASSAQTAASTSVPLPRPRPARLSTSTNFSR